MKAQKCTF